MSAPDFQAEARELNTTLTQLRVLRAMPGDCEARIAEALRAAYGAGAAKERERIHYHEDDLLKFIDSNWARGGNK